MTQLLPVPGRPGEYRNPAWLPGEPGTFAVIIGVSAYRYLHGGTDPVGQNFGLGQLHVSAATGHRFFRWLRDQYDYAEAPLARCWLVLAPTAEELTVLSGDEFSSATLMACRSAIGQWVAAMAELPRAAAQRSRGILFFSGHGLEIWQDKQILLPSDYLEPPLGNVNDAISTANLRAGLAASPVDSHYLFIDACRNDAAELRQLNVDGQRILNEPMAAGINVDTVVATLYAAASGTETWQPRELQQGYSVFGGALIDGLQGSAGLELKGCTQTSCQVHFHPLETFVKARMGQVLAQFNSQQKVRVRAGGSVADECITAVSAAAAVPGAGGPPVTVTPILESSYDIHSGVRWPVTDPWIIGHEIFGSERMTDLWSGTAKLVSLSDAAPLPASDIVITAVDRSHDAGTFRITVELPDSRRGHWLQLTDATGREFACVLPTDAIYRPRFELHIDLQRSAPDQPYIPSWISRFEVRLSLQTRGPARSVARLWDLYETHNAAAAASNMDLSMLERLVQRKTASPLAAAVVLNGALDVYDGVVDREDGLVA